MSSAFPAHDTLHLWWLANPASPRLIGKLETVRTLRGVSLRYADAWRANGVALSEDLPLNAALHLPAQAESAAGAVDDARPDRWGERVIRVLDKPARLSLMEFLHLAGDERFGALGVSTSDAHYEPRWIGPLPQLADLEALAALVRQVSEGERASDAQLRRLLGAGASMGGTRPKALISLGGQAHVLKFGEAGDAFDSGLAEHASMRLAALAGIRVASTQVLPVPGRSHHAVAVARFDRAPSGQRLHALSAKVALQAAGERLGYPELAQWLRRRGVPGYREQMKELFRRMVFNILIDNTDDHEKNHALLMSDTGEFALSPAYDVLPSAQSLGYQQMRVGKLEADSTLENALSDAALFGLKPADAQSEVRAVAQVVDGWQAHFAKHGVPAKDIATLADHIDRPFLRDQRKAFAKPLSAREILRAALNPMARDR